MEAAAQARVLELVLRRLYGVTSELEVYPPGTAPPDHVHAVWAGVCDLVDRTRQSGNYQPAHRRARRFIFQRVNRVVWLLLRAWNPSSHYRNLTPESLTTEYCLSDLPPEIALRAVRLSWVRRCVMALRTLYAYLSDVEAYQNVTVEAIAPSIDGLVAELDRHRRVLPRYPFPVPVPASFEETSAALVAAGIFAI